MRSGSPVTVPADPVIYTWILDLPREMTSNFRDLYRQAWAHYAEKDYDTALEIANQLKVYPGRNALEEVKFQVLAASLASRREDAVAELQHLSRVMAFQNLAMNNNFKNTYVPQEQYLMMLRRIQTLQLDSMMLGDAGVTLAHIQTLGAGSEISTAAQASYREAELVFYAQPDVTVKGELVSLFPDGPGLWKTRLSRSDFSISDTRFWISARINCFLKAFFSSPELID